MRRLIASFIMFVLAALAALAWGEDDTAPDAPLPKIHAASWIEGDGDAQTLVIALHREAGAARPDAPPVDVAIGIALITERVTPDYGKIGKDAWRSVKLAAGEVVFARVDLAARGGPSVLLAPRAATTDIDVHELVHGDLPDGAFFFDRPTSGGPVHVAQHVVEIGESVRLSIDAPTDDGFFRDETLEILRVARRLPVDSNDPDGPGGSAAVRWSETDDDGVTLLAGEDGERAIRAHFENADCTWANRHVGWMKDFWILAWDRPAALSFTLDTSDVKRAGRILEHWHDYGALCWESIWPNGFGGSSSNLTMPALLVVPKDAPRRTATLDR